VVIDGATRTFTLEKGKENLLEAGLRTASELAVLVQRAAGVLDLPLPHRRGRGRHGRQLRAAGLDGRSAGFISHARAITVTDYGAKVTFDEDGHG
jgi:hypothetical protein